MKNVLILTDFSSNATHAALTGLMLAKNVHANILLFNSNTVQQVAPAYAGGPTVIDEINIMEEENKERLKKLKESLEPFLEETGRRWKPVIHYEEGVGALAYEAEKVMDSRNIELVVMGARKGSRLDHFLTGSETFSVIDHSKRPVLIVPYETELTHLKKVVFATDFDEADMKAIHYLVKLGDIFNFQLDVVHINVLGEEDITKKLRKIEFVKHVHRLRHANLEINEIYGEDIIDRLNRRCENVGGDLLAFSHYKDSFMSRLFNQSIARKALEKQKSPLLIFPSKFE